MGTRRRPVNMAGATTHSRLRAAVSEWVLVLRLCCPAQYLCFMWYSLIEQIKWINKWMNERYRKRQLKIDFDVGLGRLHVGDGTRPIRHSMDMFFIYKSKLEIWPLLDTDGAHTLLWLIAQHCCSLPQKTVNLSTCLFITSLQWL